MAPKRPLNPDLTKFTKTLTLQMYEFTKVYMPSQKRHPPKPPISHLQTTTCAGAFFNDSRDLSQTLFAKWSFVNAILVICKCNILPSGYNFVNFGMAKGQGLFLVS